MVQRANREPGKRGEFSHFQHRSAPFFNVNPVWSLTWREGQAESLFQVLSPTTPSVPSLFPVLDHPRQLLGPDMN
jgi:hypothetical protein